jgi:hypothetical protein
MGVQTMLGSLRILLPNGQANVRDMGCIRDGTFRNNNAMHYRMHHHAGCPTTFVVTSQVL